jgi:hypothetical protein
MSASGNLGKFQYLWGKIHNSTNFWKKNSEIFFIRRKISKPEFFSHFFKSRNAIKG